MRKPFAISMSLLALATFGGSRLPASEIYIGNAASSGATFTSSNRADGVSNLTYIFSTDAYSPALSTPVKLDQVNFFTGAGGAGQTVTPFVALYTGGGTDSGANFTLLLQGDPITAVSGLNDAQFTVGGNHPVVTVPAGGVLVSGEFQTGNVVYFDPGSVGNVDIFNGNVIPGSVGGVFPTNPNYVFTAQSYWFDIGLHTVPEPSSFVLCAAGAIGLFIAARRRRTT